MKSFLAWMVLLLSALAVAGASMLAGDWLDTDISHLLPSEHQDPLIEQALARDRSDVSGELLVLLRGNDPDARQAARTVYGLLQESGEVMPARSGSSEAFLASLRSYRHGLVTPERFQALDEAPRQTFLSGVQRRLARPSPSAGASFSEDPAGLFSEFIAELPPPYPGFRLRDGLWHRQHDGRDLWLMPLTLSGQAFQRETQEQVLPLLDQARAKARAECPECDFMATGPVLFAADQESIARSEIMLLSTLSLGGILILILFAFGRFRPLLMGSLALLTGVTVAAATSFLLFGRLHAITLVAGTTLLGIAIDYVFKYLVHRTEAGPARGGGEQVVLKLRRPLALGVMSSLLCLGVLAVSPFPVMRELAVFSGAGLAGAWLTVVLLFPYLDRRGGGRLNPSLTAWVNRPVAGFARLGGWRWLLPLVCLPLGLIAFLMMPGSDDLRAFQADLPERLAADQRLRQLSGTDFPSGFFLIQGADAASVLERESRLLSQLDAVDGDRRALALSRIVPPATRQSDSHALIGKALNDPELGQTMRDMGVAAATLARMREAWAAAEGDWLYPSDLQGGPLGPMVDNLWIDAETGMASLVVPPGGLSLPPESDWPEGVRYLQPLELMNDNLSHQRQQASRWILLAAVIGIPLLFMALLGPARGFQAALAPLSALSLTLAFLWLSGIGLNTFVLMGVILGLGVGADYAAFLSAEADVSAVGVTGIALAAVTTLLAFGLLGLSQVPALGQFGLTVVVGIIAAWLCAFSLALPRGVSGNSVGELKS